MVLERGDPRLPEVKICQIGDHRTISFASEELARYLKDMTGEKVQVKCQEAYDPPDRDALWVGTVDSFPGILIPTVKDSRFDDAIYIKVEGGKGIISSVNPRSVLLAVYRYLTQLGCRWVRPGKDGEFIPRVNLIAASMEVSEAASYRHRGICIEGAVSYQHVRDMIEWAPKVGFNGYFIQFREGYTFFDRWYSHKGNPCKEPEDFSAEKARELVAMLADEIKRRDLLYHAVGHGWTCEPLGLPGLGWDYPPPAELPPSVTQYLALINGERKLWQGIPLNTNLCYSNSEVRHLIIQEISDYLQKHPEIDVLHFWLADGSNNQCECEECRKARPSDFYVRMLNELDELLTAENINTRIVFLIYVDLLWPPESEYIKNPDRFILMFAPITRTYSRPFTPEASLPALPPYERNHLSFPRNVEENVAFLRAWQGIFQGDSFDFDYHYMWDHYNDPGYIQIARVLHSDIRHLGDIGLNGYMSCQTQRAFFPTGLGMVVMGWSLWNKELDFKEIAKDYFRAAFGPDWHECYEYLKRLSELFDPVYLRGEKPETNQEAAESLSKIPEVIEEFRPIIEKNANLTNRCQAASWNYLRHHADICRYLAGALEARARGSWDTAFQWWERLKAMAWEREDALNQVLDVWLFIRTLEPKFRGEPKIPS